MPESPSGPAPVIEPHEKGLCVVGPGVAGGDLRRADLLHETAEIRVTDEAARLLGGELILFRDRLYVGPMEVIRDGEAAAAGDLGGDFLGERRVPVGLSPPQPVVDVGGGKFQIIPRRNLGHRHQQRHRIRPAR